MYAWAPRIGHASYDVAWISDPRYSIQHDIQSYLEMCPKFQAFNPRLAVDVYHRNLPHWRQTGCTYFVTFRLADSIPRTVQARWKQERRIWLQANGVLDSMSQSERADAYSKIDTSRRVNFEHVEARRLFAEFDQCHGCCLFKDPPCRAILHESMLYFDRQRYWAGDFVVMPNHVHWIIQPFETYSLETILQSIKRYTSTQLTKRSMHIGGRLWQNESHDRIIRDRAELARIRQYIQDNPVKARLKDTQYTMGKTGWLDG